MTDFLPPTECDITCYRHGCDPPFKFASNLPSQGKHPVVPIAAIPHSIHYDSVVCSNQFLFLLHFPHSVVDVRPCLYTSLDIQTEGERQHAN